MDIATTVNVILCILSFVLAAISVGTVVISLRQNNKMIEQTTRPSVSFYTDDINTGSPTEYFITKNFGGSPAIIDEIECDHDFIDFMLGSDMIEKDALRKSEPIRLLKGATLAPGQSRICALNYHSLPETIKIKIKYHSLSGKTYTEECSVNLLAGSGILRGKSSGSSSDEKKDIKNISYTLQEILQKQL